MSIPSKKPLSLRSVLPLSALIAAAGLNTLPSVHAASQIWTNAPVSASWANITNWVGKAAPGDINITTVNTVNADIATFNAPLLGGIGGVGNPIIPDDATVINGRSRRVLGITFDTTNCGPYVIYSPSAAQITDGSSTLTTGNLYVSHNGAIRINDSVTNSQKVLVPMLVNLPSSTAGIFNLVNNSTNPGVTLTIASITHAGATTRATTFILDGTNTANNIVTNLSEGGGNATGGFTKQGPGTWIIAGPSTFPGASPLNINNGLLAVQDPGAFGVATVANISVTNSVLRIDGVTLNNNGITLRNGGTIRMNGTATLNGVTVSPVAGNSCTLATTSASDIFTIGNAVNTLTGGAIDSVLHVAGPGTVLLSQQDNYAGKWSVDAGTNQLAVQGALGTGPNLNLAAGAVLDVSPIGATTYTLDTKALTASGTGTAVGSTAATIMADTAGVVDFVSKPLTLTFAPTAFSVSDTGHPALLCSRGTLSFHGNAITVNITNASNTPLGAGTYQIVHQAAGNISSSGAFVALVGGAGLGAGLIAEINAVGGDLNLVVTAYTPKGLVWNGGDVTLPNTWDRQTSINWLAGVTPSTFNIYDGVTFNATGSAQPIVNLASTMVPGSVTVDTSANSYTFSGAGQIAGGTSLVKINTGGTLNLQTANTYTGGTIISNGVVKLGIDEGVSSTGAGDVALYSPAVFDLNNFANTVNALNGNGTVDITGGGTSTLSIGANGNSGTFAGILQNSSGTLNITKLGTGSETMTHSNSYSGTTDIEAGTLKATDPNAIGAGTSALVINGGSFDLATNITVASLAGNGGVISAVSTTTTNTLTVQSNVTTSFSGSITGGKIALRVLAGSLRMMAANTYSNGTYVGSGATFLIHNSPAAVTGALIASNNATIGLSGGSSTPGTPTTVTTVDGALVTVTSGAEGEIWTGQFLGSATTTNHYVSPQSIGGVMSFSNFLGLVRIDVTNANFRFFNGAGFSGGDNTTFEFDSGNVHTRDAQSVSLGAVVGGNPNTGGSGIGGNTTGGTITSYIIGAKNTDCSFEGYISGSNNVVKAGTGRLTLDGAPFTLNTDSATYTNILYSGSALTYLNTTTVSNGVLAISVPNDLSTSPNIVLATPAAVLDTFNMGYITNYTDVNGANSALVTNGILTIVSGQTLGGVGTVKGKGVICNGNINPGIAYNTALGYGNGMLSISNGLTVTSGSTLFFDLSDDTTGLVKSNDQVKVQGNLGLTGSSTVTIGGNLKVGTYTLIKYSGSLTNESGVVPTGPISNLTLGGQLNRATMSLANAPGEVDLIVTSVNPLNLTWTGDSISNWWDTVTSYSWSNNLSFVQFYQNDNILFDNTPTTNLVAILQGTLIPGTILVNSSTNYTFGGTGTIGGSTPLIKSGTGTLILTNGVNSYTGGTSISNGVLNVGSDSGGNQNDLALGLGAVVVNTGGELRFGGNTGTTVVNHYITNAIILNGGIVKAQDGAQHLTNSVITLTANGGALQTVFSTKNMVLESPIVGTGPLTISVPAGFTGGSVTFSNAANTVSGAVIIATNGILALAGPAGISNSASLDIQQGGFLDILGRPSSAWSVLSGQTLKGNGTIRGRLVTVASGATLAPGIAGAIGTLFVTNTVVLTNYSVLTLAGTTSMDINRGVTPNADRIQCGTNNFGGTLTVNNLGAALVAGDTFQLFSSVTNLGSFTTLNLPTLATGLGWSNSLAVNGRLTVITTVLIPTIPPAITNFSLVGGNVVISGTNGQAGGTYYLLSTTNLTNARNQWKTVATNILGANNFTFIGTNAVTPSIGQQFYMLSSTNYNP